MKKITLSILLLITNLIAPLNEASGQTQYQPQYKITAKNIKGNAEIKQNFIYINPGNYEILDIDSLIKIEKRFSKTPVKISVLNFYLYFEDSKGKIRHIYYEDESRQKKGINNSVKSNYIQLLRDSAEEGYMPLETAFSYLYQKAIKEKSACFQLSDILVEKREPWATRPKLEKLEDTQFLIVSGRPTIQTISTVPTEKPKHLFARLIIESSNQERSNGKSIPVKSLDKDGKIIESTVTDQWGDFSLSVKDKSELNLKIDAKLEKDQKLFLARQTGKVVREIKRNAKGDFMFSILPADIVKLELTEEADPVLKLAKSPPNPATSTTLVKRISFANSNYDISEKAKGELESIVSYMKANPKIHLELIGHTDSKGGEQANLILSNKRVQSIISYLNKNGIQKGRLIGYGKGESQLLNRCKDSVECSENEHEQNRRVELIFGYRKKVEFSGTVLNDENKPIEAEITVEDERHEIKKIRSNPMTGKYMFSANLMQGRSYTINIMNDIFFVSTKEFKVSESDEKNKELANIKTILPKLKKGGKYTLGNIHFQPDSPELLRTSYPSVISLCKLMKKNPKMIIQIQGHVNHPFNGGLCNNPNHQHLSELRAQTVYNILISKNIEKDRLSYVGLGDKEQLYPRANSDEEFEKNRRVEIKVVRVK